MAEVPEAKNVPATLVQTYSPFQTTRPLSSYPIAQIAPLTKFLKKVRFDCITFPRNYIQSDLDGGSGCRSSAMA